ncbi:hypothetical protein ACLKMH_16650 [Psychromonas sp. KJ10-10]|uniref:hypothetical protein n=1 Tax=Psychromonas sp. KJ10-10 TaxID=3391823 RepID=UPI0039B38D08
MQQITQFDGLILSRQQRDTASGIELTLWVKGEMGACEIVITGQTAVFLIKQDDLSKAQTLWQSLNLTIHEIRPLSLSNFNQQPVVAIYSLTTADSRLFATTSC